MKKGQSEEISSLLNSIKKGIKKFGLKNLNDSLEAILDKKDGIDYVNLIAECVCNEYKITRRNLIHSNNRGDIQEARTIFICLLHFNANLKIRYIAKRIFNRDYHTFVFEAIKRHRGLDEKSIHDRKYKQKYDRIESEIKLKLNDDANLH